MKNQHNTILFDLDGTLTDSGPGIMRCAGLAMEQLGVPYDPSPAVMRVFVGPPLRLTFARFGVPADKLDEAIRIFRYHYNEKGGKFENTPYAGIRQLLEALRKDGYHLYVATSKMEKLAIDILDHFALSECFDRIAGGSQDQSRENKNDVIRYLLQSIDHAGSPVMVGDTVYDVEGASDLGIPCIGVSWGYGLVSEMRAAGAIAIADDIPDLYRILTGNLLSPES